LILCRFANTIAPVSQNRGVSVELFSWTEWSRPACASVTNRVFPLEKNFKSTTTTSSVYMIKRAMDRPGSFPTHRLFLNSDAEADDDEIGFLLAAAWLPEVSRSFAVLELTLVVTSIYFEK